MLFLVFVIGEILIIPIYFLSVEHTRLQKRYGTDKGNRIGDVLGLVSGWCYFGFWIGIWLSPQPRFILLNSSLLIELVSLQVNLAHLVLFLVFITPGAWLGIEGVRKTGMKTAETHRPESLVTDGLYGRMRHPQYTGAILSHVGMTFLVSGMYSLLVTPFMVVLTFMFCLKEEKELLREFGEEYEDYRRRVPMFLPH
jgi:protein-S-isoprenylcysteine O-methyltransferase Ste14